jgi:hypothetical protein
MFDRRNAPWSALAASFGVVLVIGLFTHHSSSPAQPAKASGSPRSSASAAPRNTPGTGSSLTVSVTEIQADVPFTPPAVTVSDDGQAAVNLGRPTRHPQDTGDYEWIRQNVAAGSYRVCVKPPPGWMVVTTAPCLQAAPGSQVTFELAHNPTSNIPGV